MVNNYFTPCEPEYLALVQRLERISKEVSRKRKIEESVKRRLAKNKRAKLDYRHIMPTAVSSDQAGQPQEVAGEHLNTVSPDIPEEEQHQPAAGLPEVQLVDPDMPEDDARQPDVHANQVVSVVPVSNAASESQEPPLVFSARLRGIFSYFFE
jgi:hypothetical protein